MLEKEILRSFIEYPENINKFCDKLSFEIFSEEARRYLNTILDLKDKNLLSLSTFIDSLSEELKARDFFIALISANVNPLVNKQGFILAKKYQIKKQKEIANQLLNASNENVLLDLNVLSNEMDIQTKDIMDLNEWLKYYENKPKLAKLSTGLAFIDNAFNGGLEEAQLMLISGDAEAGKTTLALQILEHFSIYKKVGFFSFEFSVDYYLRSIKEQNKKLRNENFFIINDGYEISEIISNIKRLAKRGVKYFLIDSQMRIEVNSKGLGNMEEKESFKFSALAKICHSLGVFIMLIIQTSKTDSDSPTGSKKGAHEASIILRIEKIKPKKDDLAQRNNEFDEYRRLIKLKKNKQTGKHFQGEVAFNPISRSFMDLKNDYKTTEFISVEDVKKELDIEDVF